MIMQDDVLVSVVMPAYNHESYAQDAIKSIISQNHKRLELIVIDDGSTDNTWQKIKEMEGACKSRFERVVFKRQKNAGTGATLNKLFGLCKGDYVYVIASDDVSVPSAIAEQLDFLRSNKECALCVGDNAYIDSAGNVCYQDENGSFTSDKMAAKFFTFGQALQETRKLDFATDDFGKYSELFKINHVPNGYLIRRKSLAGFKFSKKAPLEDWALMLYLSKYYKFKYIDKVLFKYRQHSSNTIRNLEAIYKKELRTVLTERARLPLLKLSECLPCVRAFVNEKLKEQERARRILLNGPVAQKNVNYSIESKIFEGEGTYVRGWAFCDGEDCQVFIKCGNKFYESVMQKRPDVQTELNLDNDRLGFYAFLPFELNGYSLLLVNKTKNELYACKIEDKKIIKSIVKKLLPKKVVSALRLFRDNGFLGLLSVVKAKFLKRVDDAIFFLAWRKRKAYYIPLSVFGISKKTFDDQRNERFEKNVKFSILVPLYNTPKPFLQEMIASVLLQSYENWELCLADGSDNEHAYVQNVCQEIASRDKRIVYKKLEKNGGISENTNECVKLASGDYVSLFDHDDLLHPSALYETMKAICEKGADFVYTDEATFESPNLNKIIHTNFKPDYAPDYFCSVNYVCHFSSFKRTLLDVIGKLDSGADGAQDFDLFLRIFEHTNKIIHVPKCLYFWRASPASTAFSAKSKDYTNDAGALALRNHFERCGINAFVSNGQVPNSYKINYEIVGEPLVSIIIPNYDHWQTLKKCVESIKTLTTYKNYEIIVVENNSKEKETFDYYETLKKEPNIKIVVWEKKFNYSAINNFAVGYAKGEYLLLLNNDIEVISPKWIEEMLMFAQRKDVGAVGAMLYYPSGKIQHAGVVLGIGGVAGHSHKCFSKDAYGYVSRLITIQNFSAVTAACCMIPMDVYKKVNGFDEAFEVAFNDVDFCMRVRKAGYLIVWTPYAQLYHHESESRGSEDTPQKQARFIGEVTRFQCRWKNELAAGDPYYNPNLTLEREDFTVIGEPLKQYRKAR